MRAVIAGEITRALTSPRLREARRNLSALKRWLTGGPAVVHCFHQADDPYSHLVLQVLTEFAQRYDVRLAMHLVPPPDDAAAPDRARLEAWSRRDAADLAGATGLAFVDPGREPDPDATSRANRVIAAAIQSSSPVESTLQAVTQASRALWCNDRAALERMSAADAATTDAMLAEGADLRRRLGHYLGAMLYFEGEWYWGVDRLGLLEQRLRSTSLARSDATSPIVAMPQVDCRRRPTNGHRPRLQFFCSLRSPYTYLAVPRVRQLADTYDAVLELRFVLPMVMRGLPIPREKRFYILRDTKREAEGLGMPFGLIVDPVGRPTERGLAVLHRAVAAGTGPQFLESFMRGVWAEGVDAGSDRGLVALAARARLDAAFVSEALADESWREVARANRDEMLGLGLWGVPSFRVDDGPGRWGQDRLWQVERDLIAATAADVQQGGEGA